MTSLHLIYRPIFKIGKCITLSVTLTACVEICHRVSGRRIPRLRRYHCTYRIASPVGRTGSVRMGKDKGYNHVCAADASPSQNCAMLSLIIWPIQSLPQILHGVKNARLWRDFWRLSHLCCLVSNCCNLSKIWNKIATVDFQVSFPKLRKRWKKFAVSIWATF